MLIDFNKVNIYLKSTPTDMRKAIGGLSVMVEKQLSMDPLSGHLFLFCNRNRKILKALYWDRNGFCLWQKKLQKDKFPWPDSSSVEELSYNEFKMLLDGIDFFHAHKRLSYSSVG